VVFEDGRIVVYDKKNKSPRMRHIDYGLGVFRREAFGRIAPDAVYDLAVLYQELLAEGQLAAFEVRERFYEVGSFDGIRELSERLKS
jgi:hypothetical protein